MASLIAGVISLIDKDKVLLLTVLMERELIMFFRVVFFLLHIMQKEYSVD